MEEEHLQETFSLHLKTDERKGESCPFCGMHQDEQGWVLDGRAGVEFTLPAASLRTPCCGKPHGPLLMTRELCFLSLAAKCFRTARSWIQTAFNYEETVLVPLWKVDILPLTDMNDWSTYVHKVGDYKYTAKIITTEQVASL